MSEKKGSTDKDIELNEAFERLEAQVKENRQAAQDDKAEAPPARSARRAAQPEASGGSGGLLGGLALFIALVALGVASFGAYMLWQMQQDQSAALAQQRIQQRVSELNQTLSSVQAEVKSRDAELAQTLKASVSAANDAAELVEARLVQAVAEIKQQVGTTSEDWLLAEAEYLLRLANQRVAMEDDPAGALALFEAADEIIEQAEGVVAFDLRQSIAADMAALRGLDQLDTAGTFVQIGALVSQVESLQQKQLKFAAVPVEDEPLPLEPTLLQRAWHLIKSVGNRLASLVDYRSDGTIIRPMLPPEEEYYLKQNLVLKLQLAQLGLLRGNQAVYQQSLSDASIWIDQYFDSDAALTISVKTQLDLLAARQIAIQLPDVSGSLREIRKLMSRFHEVGERTEP